MGKGGPLLKAGTLYKILNWDYLQHVHAGLHVAAAWSCSAADGVLQLTKGL